MTISHPHHPLAAKKCLRHIYVILTASPSSDMFFGLRLHLAFSVSDKSRCQAGSFWKSSFVEDVRVPCDLTIFLTNDNPIALSLFVAFMNLGRLSSVRLQTDTEGFWTLYRP